MEKYINLENLSYNCAGKGKTIILLHGYLESKEIWGDFAQKLALNYKVISIDFPGHGHSKLEDKTYSMSDYADSVDEVLKAENIKKATIIGHSMGGYVALAFAEKYPKKLAALCLFHSTPFADTSEKKELRSKTIEQIIKGKGTSSEICKKHCPEIYAPENVEKFYIEIKKAIKIALNMSESGIVNSLEAMKNRPDYQDVFENLKVPVCYIIGKKDNFIPIEILEKIKMPKNSQTYIFENSGHAGHIEEPKKSLSIIEQFLLKVR